MSLALVDGGGTLTIREAEEPTSLARPTTLTATVDDATGIITDGTFVAAPLSFQFDITTPIATTVYVDATFTQITPGSVAGAVTKLSETKAAVSVGVDVEVDLHVEVGRPAFLTSDCTATPVSLRLTSTVPYDAGTHRLTLEDADFRVPPVTASGARCNEIIADGVNERLAGGGHSISMTMTGEIPPIRIGTYETTTTLTAAPTSSRQGDEVTLSATVTPRPGPDAPGDPISGVVELRDGTTLLASVPVEADGAASFTTDALPVGHRELVAAYQGDEVYAPSTNAVVSHLVAAAPTVVLPETISAVVIEGNPRPFTAALANPAEIGAPIDGARLDVTIARVGSTGAVLTPDRMTLEHFDGSTWTPLTLTQPSPRVLRGSVPGVDLAPGDRRDVRLRVRAFAVGTIEHATQCAAAQPTCPGPLTVTAELVAGDDSRTFATDEAPADLVERTRRATTVGLGGGTPQPHTVRPGYSIIVPGLLGPNFGGVPWGGVVEVYIDGVQFPMHDGRRGFEDNPVDQFEVSATTTRGWVMLPEDIEPGSHLVTLRYLGDAFHGPGEVTATFTVIEQLPQVHAFVCRDEGLLSSFEWGAQVVFDISGLPDAVLAGTEIPIEVDDARLLMQTDVGVAGLDWLQNGTMPADPSHSVGLRRVTFGFDGQGTASATSIVTTGSTRMRPTPNPAPESAVDQTHTFEGLAGTVTADGVPGDVVPVALTELVFAYAMGDIPLEARCAVRSGPMALGEVAIAGTTVSASPALAREGTDEVVIEARTFPADAAGTVTFSSDLDGTLGTDTVTDGVASWSAGNLRPGTHVITASFDATDPVVPDSVGTVTVRVSYSPRTATERFVVAARTDYLGSADRVQVVADAAALDGGKTRTAYLDELSLSDAYLTHVVNEVYLDTLGREGDEAGVAFWVGRLRAGWTVARVAANFYSSDEYHRRVGGTDEAWVRDLYEVLLGRGADEPGLAYWIGEVPRRGRGGVALAFFQTPESARARVTALYGQFLGRRPSPADRDFWAARVIARGDLILAVELTLSSEYGNRAANRFPIA